MFLSAVHVTSVMKYSSLNLNSAQFKFATPVLERNPVESCPFGLSVV